MEQDILRKNGGFDLVEHNTPIKEHFIPASDESSTLIDAVDIFFILYTKRFHSLIKQMHSNSMKDYYFQFWKMASPYGVCSSQLRYSCLMNIIDFDEGNLCILGK